MKKILDLLTRFWRDERGGWFIWLLVAIAFQVIAFLLRPKPKTQKPPEAQDLENPVAERGKPVPVVFGTVIVKGLNVLWYGDKQKRTFQINA
jgi:hypothetical protein